MTDNEKQSKLRLTVITAAIAAGLLSTATTVFAEDGNVSEKDMLTQAVALYEKLSGEQVSVPDALKREYGDENLAKAVMLGFKNTEEVSYVSDAVTIRKQDALTVLYKTVLSYDYSYALSSDEIDEIMNGCFDNALIDEENRAGFAFMLKHGIIDSGMNTEPNKIITWDGCRTLVDVLYDLFVQDVYFTVDGNTIKIGANISTVTDSFGEPSRIDKSDYDFDWYVYNTDINNFMMVGVKEDRICAFFTSADGFEFGDLQEGDSYLAAYKYIENSDFRIFKNSDDKIDAIMYNPYTKSDVTQENDEYLRSCELVDMINANRVKNGLLPLNIDKELYDEAKSMAVQPKYHELARDLRYAHTMDGAQHEEGYDIFLIYQKLTEHGGECFREDIKSIGVSTYADESFNIYTSIKCSSSESELTTQPSDITDVSPDTYVFETTASAEESEPAFLINTESDGTYVFETTSEGETGTDETLNVDLSAFEVLSPANGSVADPESDLVIKLSHNVAPEYYVSIYSIEEDRYVVNSYIKTDSDELVLTHDLFTQGMDYTVTVSAVSGNQTSESKEFTFCYGTVPDNALILLSSENIKTDNDTIELSWASDLYSNFVIDAYDADGKLVLSEIVTDIKDVTINNVDPGTYYIYITALRNGTEDVFKAQQIITAEVTLPEPVITEYILEEGEKFYPVYEDKEMGLLYFYDEEIVDVETVSPNGRTTTQKRKKITEKQVKSVAYYRNLAMSQERVEYFVGSSTPTLKDRSNETVSYNGSKMSIYDQTIGDAAVEETKKYLGVKYVWGGTTPNGFDCSGLVQYVYKNLGITLNRVSQDQYRQGMPLTREELMPGDLVFFEDNGDVHHVGIYVGDGYMIHAPYTGAVVSYQSIDTPYYKSQFCGGRRVY